MRVECVESVGGYLDSIVVRLGVEQRANSQSIVLRGLSCTVCAQGWRVFYYLLSVGKCALSVI